MTAAHQIPNNLGPFLLIVAGLLLSPIGIGVPLILFAVSRIRAIDGSRDLSYVFPWPRNSAN